LFLNIGKLPHDAILAAFKNQHGQLLREHPFSTGFYDGLGRSAQ
jgi:hypothetical protein